jgi:folate-dependent phosphoribosylglycinamide formyltransferase PurN
MRLTLCVKRDLHGCIFLNKLVPLLGGHEITVLLSDKHRPDEARIPALAEMAFLERSLPIDTLFPLIDAGANAAARPGEWLTFNALAAAYGYASATATRLDDVTAAFAEWQPELVISARFSLIFSPWMLEIAKHGIVNIHPAALPEFAGLFGPMHTLAAGHSSFTCAVHLADAGIDSGPLLHVEQLAVRRGEGLLHQVAEIYPLAIPYLLEMIRGLIRGRSPQRQPQDRRRRRYRSFPTPEEVGEFIAAGHRFWDPEAYQRLLRRFEPPRESHRD